MVKAINFFNQEILMSETTATTAKKHLERAEAFLGVAEGLSKFNETNILELQASEVKSTLGRAGLLMAL